MKKYIFSILCIFSLAQGMEEQITREPREWDAKAYAEGNWMQERAFLSFLEESKIDFKYKKILDIGCGTGNISAKVAALAQGVHGIDASNNMIEYAQEAHKDIPNVSFQQSFAEDFATEERFHVALSSFCLQFIENKEQALQNINKSLEMNGDFFGNLHTANDPEHLNMIVAREMIPGYSFLQGINLIKEAGVSNFTDIEFKKMLGDAGFEIISYEHKSLDFILKTREELEKYSWPLVTSRPIAQKMPTFMQNLIFSQYINLYLTKLTTNEEGYYIFPAVRTTVFHARKIADLQ